MTAGPGCLSAPTTPARQYGQTTTSAPVFAASSNRTLAGMAYDLLLEDHSFDGLLLEGERSWQVRHDLGLGALGLPGLSLHALQARGRFGASAGSAGESIYAGLYGRGGRHREKRPRLRLSGQGGPLAGLALRASQAWHRGNASYLDGDIDETRLVVDYSRSIW